MIDRRKPSDHSRPRNGRLPVDSYGESGRAVLITLRSDRGAPFATASALCSAVTSLLREMRLEYGCWVGAYCLMTDHLHFLTGPSTDGRSVLTFVDRFKGKTTNASWAHGWSGRLWQKRSHDHVLRSADSLSEISEYTLANPVRAGLVERSQDWPWAGIIDHQP